MDSLNPLLFRITAQLKTSPIALLVMVSLVRP